MKPSKDILAWRCKQGTTAGVGTQFEVHLEPRDEIDHCVKDSGS